MVGSFVVPREFYDGMGGVIGFLLRGQCVSFLIRNDVFVFGLGFESLALTLLLDCASFVKGPTVIIFFLPYHTTILHTRTHFFGRLPVLHCLRPSSQSQRTIIPYHLPVILRDTYVTGDHDVFDTKFKVRTTSVGFTGTASRFVQGSVAAQQFATRGTGQAGKTTLFVRQLGFTRDAEETWIVTRLVVHLPFEAEILKAGHVLSVTTVHVSGMEFTHEANRIAKVDRVAIDTDSQKLLVELEQQSRRLEIHFVHLHGTFILHMANSVLAVDDTAVIHRIIATKRKGNMILGQTADLPVSTAIPQQGDHPNDDMELNPREPRLAGGTTPAERS